MHTAPAAVHSRTAANLQSDPTPSPNEQVHLSEKLLLDEHVGALCTMLRGASPYTTTAGTVSTQAAALEL